jgi:PAS domain S-box-containing protein
MIFLLLTGAIGATGYAIYRYQERAVQSSKQAELNAIADTKVEQIAAWIAERRADALAISTDPFLAEAAQHCLQIDTQSADSRLDQLHDRLSGLKQAYGYTAVALLDNDGQRHLCVGDLPEDPHLPELRSRVLQRKQAVLSELHRDNPDGPIELTLLAPLKLKFDGIERIAGMIYLRIDPEQYLFPLIQTWPLPSPSAETLLVRREGDDVLFLNELRHRKNTALNLRFAVSEPQLPAARAVLGQAGLFEGEDYRQVPVLAAMWPVPGTAWFLIAKVDVAEIYAAAQRVALLVGMLVSVFIAAAGVGVGLWWRQQHALFLADHYRSELEREALVRHFDYLARYANDIVLLLDGEGRVSEANDRAISAYGYSHDLLRSLTLSELSDPDQREQISAQFALVESSGGLVYETTHQRKDGSLFPVEVSARPMRIEGQLFFQHIIRDITERKQAEQALVRARDESRQAEEQVKQRQAELAHVNRLSTLGEMASSIAHELNQPLTAIANYCDAALMMLHNQNSPTPNKLVHALQQAISQAQRAGEIVRHLRQFVRKGTQGRERTDLNTLVRETVAFTEAEARFEGATITLDLTESLPTLIMDKIQIQQVLVNLLHNSLEAMEQADSSVRQLIISTARIQTGKVQVTVEDTGPGLDPAIAERLFQRFLTTKAHGIGLGLSISRSIIEAHGGRLWTEPTSGSGAIFHFTLSSEVD